MKYTISNEAESSTEIRTPEMQYTKNCAVGSRVAGTMVVCLSSVRVIAHSNPSHLPLLLMHVGK